MLTNLAVRDIETLVHPYTNLATHREVGPLVLERGKGVFVYDTTGKDYIEGMAGLWCTSLGYSNQELAETAYEQLKKLPFTHLFSGRSHDPAIELAEKLKEIAPVPISKVFYGASGSDANDTQVKLVWYMNNALGRPKKKKIISRLKGYHGVTVASASLTGLPANHTDFDLPLPGILHTSSPHHYRFAQPGESELDFSARLAAELDEMIQREGPDTVAAFIAEPVMGAGGAVTPPEGYFEAINAVLAKYDILFIADEVITGFGRTGQPFGAQTFGVTPDLMTVAKGLTNGCVPMGAVIARQSVYDAFMQGPEHLIEFFHGYTYSAHPLACAAGLATLETYADEGLLTRATELQGYFAEALHSLKGAPHVIDIRNIGLVGGIELAPRAGAPTQRAFDVFLDCYHQQGVLIRTTGDTIALSPPLIIERSQIDQLVEAVGRAIRRVA